MATVSIIIPFRGANSHRLQNLQAVVRHFSDVLPSSQIIIAEQDQSSQITGLDDFTDCECVVTEDGGVFNKSRQINIAALRAENDILIVADADFVVSKNDLTRSIEMVETKFDHARPFGRQIDLSEQATARYYNTRKLRLDDDTDSSVDSREALGEQMCLTSGIFVVKRSAFFDVGGFDERFIGWGGEDNAFELLLKQHAKSLSVKSDGIAWHLWHPRAAGIKKGIGGDNRELLIELFHQFKS